MKAILISIKPKWVEKILNGEKTIEIRKTMPKCDLPIDVYIYCTKDKPYLAHATELFTGKYGCVSNDEISYGEHNINGKVVAKFTLNKVEEYINGNNCDYLKHGASSYQDYEVVLKPSCLTDDELDSYCEDLHFFAWHIDNLEIFDKPKELSEFRLTKAPQSWCYVEGE